MLLSKEAAMVNVPVDTNHELDHDDGRGQEDRVDDRSGSRVPREIFPVELLHAASLCAGGMS